MSIVPDFDQDKYFLGNICHKQHNWSNTGQSLRYRSDTSCLFCKKLVDGVSEEELKTLKFYRVNSSQFFLGKLCKKSHKFLDSFSSLRNKHNNKCVQCSYGQIYYDNLLDYNGDFNNFRKHRRDSFRYEVDTNRLIMLSNLTYIPISKLKVGDKVLGWMQGNRTNQVQHNELCESTVVSIDQKKEEWVSILLPESNERLYCPISQRFYYGRPNQDLEFSLPHRGQKLKRLPLPLKRKCKFFDKAYMIGYIAGVMEGDGTLMPQGSYRLAMADIDCLQRVVNFVDNLGYGEFEIKLFTEATNTRQAVYQIYFPSYHPVNDMIETIGWSDMEYIRGWLAGIYDAEGNTPSRRDNKFSSALRIAQYKNINPDVYQIICNFLLKAEFTNFIEEPLGIRLSGGNLYEAKFIQWIEPAIERKKNPLIGNTLKNLFVKELISTPMPIGIKKYLEVKTSTDNGIINGYPVEC